MQYEEVKELISIFEKTDLNDMEVQLDNALIRLNRSGTASWGNAHSEETFPAVERKVSPAEKTKKVEVIPEQEKTEEKEVYESTSVIKAPIVGTFYQSASPEEEPFVKVGDKVAKGDVVCIIEAMKFMNEVNSEFSGVIEEILVKDGEFVEFGQELFRLKQ